MIIESQKPIVVGSKVTAKYTIVVKDSKGKVKFNSTFFNLLTDGYFNGLIGGTFDSRGGVSYCGVGTGSSTPAFTDTSIVQTGSRVSLFSRSYTTSSNTITTVSQYRFAASAIIATIAEVGLFSQSASGVMSSRALIKDVTGTPTTITLISGDTLYITHTAISTINLSDVTGVISIAGVNYNYVLRPASWTQNIPTTNSVNNPFAFAGQASGAAGSCLGFTYAIALSTQTLGTVTSYPAGTAYGGIAAATPATYVTNSFARSYEYTFGPALGNAPSGIGSLVFAVGDTNPAIVGWQMSFAAVSGGARIPKDATKTFKITMTYTLAR